MEIVLPCLFSFLVSFRACFCFPRPTCYRKATSFHRDTLCYSQLKFSFLTYFYLFCKLQLLLSIFSCVLCRQDLPVPFVAEICDTLCFCYCFFCSFCCSSGWCSNFRFSNSLFLNLLSYIFFFFLNVSNLSLCLDLFFSQSFFRIKSICFSRVTFYICSQHIFCTFCVVPTSCSFFQNFAFLHLYVLRRLQISRSLLFVLYFSNSFNPSVISRKLSFWSSWTCVVSPWILLFLLHWFLLQQLYLLKLTLL